MAAPLMALSILGFRPMLLGKSGAARQAVRLSDAGALPLPPGTVVSPSSPPSPRQAAPEEALPSFDSALALPALGRATSWVVRALAVTVAWAFAFVGRSQRSNALFWPRLVLGALIGAAFDRVLRETLRLAKRQAALLDPRELATRDSRFVIVSNTSVHYLQRLPARSFANGSAPPPRVLAHLNHGFGASSLSFLDVLSPLADGLGALVVAHDRLGFGLSERPLDSAKYGGKEQTVLANELLAHAESGAGCEGAVRVLFGHSLGAQLALNQALAEPGRVAALVLIAPALSSGPRRSSGPAARGGDAPKARMSALALVGRLLSGVLAAVSRAARATALRLFRPLIVQCVLLPLRLAVYSSAFWSKGLSEAWLDRSRITPATLSRYRRPSLAKDWDAGLLRFVRAMSRAETAIADEGAQPARLTLLERARELSKTIPILIIHGKEDRIISSKVLAKLAEVLGPKATLIELEGCGHVPHEECPERFLDAVMPWLRKHAAQLPARAS